MARKRAIGTTAIAVIVIVLIVIAGVGYYAYTLFQPTAPTTKLTVITFTDPSNAWLQAAAKSFDASHPGVNITVVAQRFSSYTTTELTSLEAQSPTYNIITYTSTSALGFANYVANLQGKVTINSTDIPGPQLNFGGYDQLSNGTRELIGVPYDASTFTIFYNKTLLSNAALNSQFQQEYGFSLSPPWASARIIPT